MNEVGKGNTITHDAAPRHQHAHRGRSFEHRQRLGGCADLYGLKANILQHVGRDHTDKFIGLGDEDG
ncbi:hypothetical protein A3862_10900 [Methylobacterium sp. XJLW]|nr:hypothetical protein A3862_10900 [Methylobacterium sp. XJLW]